MPSIASTAEVRAKCILLSFLLFLCFGAFTVKILASFLVSFYNHFLPNNKNDPKILNGFENELKMATVNDSIFNKFTISQLL